MTKIKRKPILALLLALALMASSTLAVFAFSHHPNCAYHDRVSNTITVSRDYSCRWCPNKTEMRIQTTTFDTCTNNGYTVLETITYGPWSDWRHACISR